MCTITITRIQIRVVLDKSVQGVMFLSTGVEGTEACITVVVIIDIILLNNIAAHDGVRKLERMVTLGRQWRLQRGGGG